MRDNLLALKPLGHFSEPLLFVCEKMEISKLENFENTLIIKQGNKQLRMVFSNETELNKWMLVVIKDFKNIFKVPALF